MMLNFKHIVTLVTLFALFSTLLVATSPDETDQNTTEQAPILLAGFPGGGGPPPDLTDLSRTHATDRVQAIDTTTNAISNRYSYSPLHADKK